MKKIFISLLSVFVLGVLFSNITPIVFAQTITAKSSSEGITVSTVKISNAHIVSQNNRDFVLSFDISNKVGAQPQVKYSVRLTQLSSGGETLMDEKVYSEVLSLGENITVNKIINYSVPTSLSAGTYRLWIYSKNGNGFMLGIAFLGDIKITGSVVNTIEIVPDSCSFVATMTMSSSSDSAALPSETKHTAKCKVISSFSTDTVFTPIFVTKIHSSFGDIIADASGPKEDITIKKGTSDISVEYNEASKPQNYDLAFNLLSADKKTTSNTVTYNYVVAGESGTIKNVIFDRTYYRAGDIANVQIFSTQTAEGKITATVSDGEGVLCSATSSKNISSFSQINLSVQINRDCLNPQANIILSSGDNILDSNNFGVTTTSTSTPETAAQTTLVVIIVIIILALIFGTLIYKKKNSAIKILILFFVFSFALFGFTKFTSACSYLTLHLDANQNGDQAVYSTCNGYSSHQDDLSRDWWGTFPLSGSWEQKTSSFSISTPSGIPGTGSPAEVGSCWILCSGKNGGGTCQVFGPDVKVDSLPHSGSGILDDTITSVYASSCHLFSITASCPDANPLVANVSWSAVGGATNYALRVDNLINGWNGLCDGSQYKGDICETIGSLSRSFGTGGGNPDNDYISQGGWHAPSALGNGPATYAIPGMHYRAWVHYVTGSGSLSDPVGTDFYCRPSAPTLSYSGPSQVPYGGTVNLTWGANNDYKNGCTLVSGAANLDGRGWDSGYIGGTLNNLILDDTPYTTFALTCNGFYPGGSTAILNIPVLPRPSADISVSPISIANGASTTISVNATSSDSCSITRSDGSSGWASAPNAFVSGGSQFALTGSNFSAPSGMINDSAGNIYVLDNNSIKKFNSLGVFQSSFGQLNNPSGIAINQAETYLYVTDTVNNRIQKFNSSTGAGSYFGTLAGGSPQGVTTDSSGNIYVVVANTTNSTVKVFDSNGIYKSSFGSQGSHNGEFRSPKGIATDSSGNIYVADAGNNRIQKFDSSGNFVWWLGFNNGSKTVGTHNDSVLMNPGTAGSALGQFNNPQGVTLDSSGNIYVVDTGNNRIQKFDSSGVYQSQVGPFSNPTSLIVDSSGNIYVSNSSLGNASVKRFLPSISLTLDSGPLTKTPSVTFTARCSFPSNANPTVSSAQVLVGDIPSAYPISINLLASSSVMVGSSTMIYWNSTGADSCTFKSPNLFNFGSTATSGAISSGALTVSKTFTMNCINNTCPDGVDIPPSDQNPTGCINVTNSATSSKTINVSLYPLPPSKHSLATTTDGEIVWESDEGPCSVTSSYGGATSVISDTTDGTYTPTTDEILAGATYDFVCGNDTDAPVVKEKIIVPPGVASVCTPSQSQNDGNIYVNKKTTWTVDLLSKTGISGIDSRTWSGTDISSDMLSDTLDKIYTTVGTKDLRVVTIGKRNDTAKTQFTSVCSATTSVKLDTGGNSEI